MDKGIVILSIGYWVMPVEGIGNGCLLPDLGTVIVGLTGIFLLY